jgi:hypothetical protein
MLSLIIFSPPQLIVRHLKCLILYLQLELFVVKIIYYGQFMIIISIDHLIFVTIYLLLGQSDIWTQLLER